MARDFASRQYARDASEPPDVRRKPRGAVPRPEPQQEETRRHLDVWRLLPAWGWLASGYLLGLLTLGGGWLALEHWQQQAVQADEPVVAVPEAATEAPIAARPAPRFDFYTLLPESEVIAPHVAAYQSTPRDAEDLPYFMLQVGSFRDSNDAERLAQRLRQLDFSEIQVNATLTDSGDQWYRVQLGPYQDRRLLARTQDNLARAGLDFMLLRLREAPPANDINQ